MSSAYLMNVKVVDKMENDDGEVLGKTLRLTNKKDPKDGVKFSEINEYYNKLLKKYDAADITILAKPLDGGFVTLKSRNHRDQSLKHFDENYFSSMPKQVKDRLQGVYYSVDITITL